MQVYFLDITQFAAEDSMDIGDWHERLHRSNSFLDTHTEPDIASRWKKHYTFLINQDNQRANFKAILRFDIEQRTRYFTAPTPSNKEQYMQRFDAIKFEILQQDIKGKKFSHLITAPFDSTDLSHILLKNQNPHESSDPDKSHHPPSNLTPICFVCRREHRRTANRRSQKESTNNLSVETTMSPYTPSSTHTETNAAINDIQTSTSAPYAAPPNIPLALASASSLLPYSFLEATHK